MSYHLNAYDYALPPELIAQTPIMPRTQARLLSLDTHGPSHHRVKDLPDLLRPGDVLVVNNSKVRALRFPQAVRQAQAERAARSLSLTLLEPRQGEPEGHAQQWWALAKPGRALRPGVEVILTPTQPRWRMRVVDKAADGTILLSFGDRIVAEHELRCQAYAPLPPYIRRSQNDERQRQDWDDYQTIFASSLGSAAAPTAGLHFSVSMRKELAARGIPLAQITLHIGRGTFRPLEDLDLKSYRLAPEEAVVPAATVKAITRCRAQGGRVVAVGTTVVRALETACTAEGLRPFSGLSPLTIRPGHAFLSVDLLLTNFHLPRSSLLVLACAFAGRGRLLSAYQEAIAQGYRFYSYGDCCLLTPAAALGAAKKDAAG